MEQGSLRRALSESLYISRLARVVGPEEFDLEAREGLPEDSLGRLEQREAFLLIRVI